MWSTNIETISKCIPIPRINTSHSSINHVHKSIRSNLDISSDIKLSIKMADNITNKPPKLVTHKYRLHPSTELRAYLNNAIDGYRYMYNKTLAYVKKHEDYNYYSVKSKLMKTNLDWLNNMPYNTRAYAIKEVITSYKSNFTKMKKKTQTHFDITYKRKKEARQTIKIPKTMINITKSIMFPSKKLRFRPIKNLPKPTGDFEVTRICDKYYLLLPINSTEKGNVDSKQDSIVALDPGIRTFQTYYSPNGNIGKLANGVSLDLLSAGKKLDKYRSILSNRGLRARTRQHIRSKYLRSITKIKNQVNDMHKKTAKYLLDNYSTILIGNLNIDNISRRKLPDRVRTLGSKTVRSLLMLSHGRFNDYMRHKASLYDDRKIIMVDESYTTRTCTKCGLINNNVGSKKVFNCTSTKCKTKIDRDYNGARNIYLKYAGANCSKKELARIQAIDV